MTPDLQRLVSLIAEKAKAPTLINAGFEAGHSLEAGKEGIARVERWREGWVTLEVEVSPGRVGFASAQLGENPLDVDLLLSRAKGSSRIFPKDISRSIPTKAKCPQSSELEIFDETWDPDDLGPGEALVNKLLEAAHRVEKDLSVRKPTFEGSREERLVFLGGETVANWHETSFGLQLEVAAGTGDERESGWAVGESRKIRALDPLVVGSEAAVRAVELLGAEGCPTGRFPALLDRRVAAEALELLSHSFLADAHRKKTTLLYGKLGTKPLSSLVSIFDDGLLPGGMSSRPVDYEGTPSMKIGCVEGGEFTAILFDRAEAAKSGSTSTGSGMGGEEGPPQPGISNFYIPAGTMTVDGMVRSMSRGIIVREVMGFHTADPITGDFSVGCSGLWVEGGKVAHPVSGVALSGNLLELFSSVEGVGSDLGFFGSTGSPTLLLSHLNVAGD